MHRFLAAVFLLIAAFFAPEPAQAQIFIVTTCGTVPGAQATLTAGNPGMLFIDVNGKLCTNATGGGGAGDASAANQTTQITAEQAIQAVIGAVADAAATVGSIGSLSAKLRLMTSQLDTINTNLQAAVPTIQSGVVTTLISCDSHVFKHITTATDTLAVQGVTAKTIYICGWRSRAAGVATWFLENTASTNANCSSSNTQINGVATEAANTGEVLNPAFWSGTKNTAGNGLCINSTGTGGVDVDIWYTQF